MIRSTDEPFEDKYSEPVYEEQEKQNTMENTETTVNEESKDVPPEWEKDEDVNRCPVCVQQFTFYLRRHHCRACGKIFCHEHCCRWISLPSYEHPERVDEKCYRALSGINFESDYDIYGASPDQTIVFLHPELGNRNNFKYQIEALSSKFRVITIDLPNHGSMQNQIFKMDNAIDAVVAVLVKECANQKVLLCGVSLGGYVAMLVAKKYPELITGLVLASCCYETYGAKSQVLFSSMDALLFAFPDSLKWKIFPTLYKQIPLADLKESVLRAGVNYDAWPGVSHGMTEPSQDYYLKAIHAYPGKVLFINGEHEKRPAEQKYVSATVKSRLHLIRGGSYVSFLEPGSRDEFNNMVEDFAKEIFAQ